MSDYEIPRIAQQFHDGGLEQLDNLLLDEREAKTMVLAGFVMGANVLLVGPPGGGKSTLSRDAYRLIDGIAADEVAIIPHHSDLTPAELVGGSVSTEKTTQNGSATATHETITATITPIIGPNTKLIWADEINRVNPFALNATLGVLETGELVTTAGKVKLEDLQMGISTMNPSENRQGTYPMTAAIASRHAMGAILGGDAENAGKRQDRMEKIAKGWLPNPVALQTVVSLDELRTLREAAKQHPIPESLLPALITQAQGVVDALADHKIVESDGRITSQIAAITKTLSTLRAQHQAGEKDVRDAVSYVVAARLGALSRKSFSETAAIAETITA
jgi:MoxR-like ATPase